MAKSKNRKTKLDVVVLQSRCIGAAVCVEEAKGSFRLDENKKAQVTDLSKNTENTLIDAARNCPAQAIFIYKNKKQIWPKPGEKGLDMQPKTDLKMSMD